VGNNRALVEKDLATGDERWRVPLHPEESTATQGYESTPFGFDGDLLIYRDKSELIAVDVVTKQPAWHIGFSRFVAIGDELAIAEIGGDYAIVDLTNGHELWRTSVLVWDPVFVRDLLLIRESIDQLTAYEARTGRKRWTLTLRPPAPKTSASPGRSIASGR